MYIKIKRLLDLTLATGLLIISSPIMVVAAIAIKLDSPGRVIFRQKRPGKDGKIFEMYKFRTMKEIPEDAEQQLQGMEGITKAGLILRRTSIDELPQLFNILKGEMSFIGPRPLLVEYLEHYSPEQMRRHQVLPGISGWAQVNGRNLLTWEEKFKYDVYYVDNISLWLDIKILYLTVYKVLKRKDISEDEEVDVMFTGSKDN